MRSLKFNNNNMDSITKETTEQIFEAVTGRRFIPDVDAAHALYVANILEQYIKLRLTAVRFMCDECLKNV